MSLEHASEIERQSDRQPEPGQSAGAAGNWRNWLLSATARAGVATGFLLTPTVQTQLGDATTVALSLFISAALVMTLLGHWYLARGQARRDLAADAFAVVALVPVGLVAAGVQGADDRFGGRTTNVLAALTATILIYAIVALIARMDERLDFGDAVIGSLGGALTLVVLIGNPNRLATADAWQALSIAWMVAAVATVVYGVLPTVARAVLPVVVYGAFALVIALLPADGLNQESGADRLAILALLITGAAMVLIAPTGSKR